MYVYICNEVDRARVYYAKWNKSVRDRQIPYDFTQWNLGNKTDEHRGMEWKIKWDKNREGGKL